MFVESLIDIRYLFFLKRLLNFNNDVRNNISILIKKTWKWQTRAVTSFKLLPAQVRKSKSQTLLFYVIEMKKKLGDDDF